MPAPRDEYASRLSERRTIFDRLSRADASLSYARLGVFAAAAALAIGGYRGWLSWWWIALPVGAFLVLIRRHDAVILARDGAARAMAFYERGIARIDDQWAGQGESGERFADPAHPYATDLDLFGRGSLFQLLSIARTRAGEETLAAWLMTAAAPPLIRHRQAAVDDLCPRLDLREQVSLAGADVRAGVNGDALIAWGEAPALLRPAWLRWAAVVLTVAILVTATLWALSGSYAALIIVLAVEALLVWPRRHGIEQVLHVAGGSSRDLDVLAHVVATIEGETFSAAQLTALRGVLDAAGVAPAAAIRRLHRLAEMHDWQHNMIFAAIAAPLLWDTHLAFAMEAWRQRYGRHLRAWLAAVGEFEALASLAAYRYEHPDDPFPDIDDEAREAFVDGDALGHPLLPAARMVRNDIRLTTPTRLLVISGSNMSGKSTFLRTVGINIVLALSGAPVRARSLRLSPLALGATLRIQDSLQEGRSRFYAEITRIRELADLAAGSRPLLFLLDELFHGTNSHDRLLGASGVLRTFLDRGAIGLVTTHDLALTAVAERLAPRSINVHFEDRFEEGGIEFDYRMKPGPVTRSNAIALMRAVGLEVGDADAVD